MLTKYYTQFYLKITNNLKGFLGKSKKIIIPKIPLVYSNSIKLNNTLYTLNLLSLTFSLALEIFGKDW